jgi:hypothetical protein
MKAPDKIFLPRFVYEKWLYQTSDTDDETEVEYIRKDALLEWINKARSIPHENAIARDLAFQEAVNKLNEM